MIDTQRILAAGLIVNAALYLLCVFTAGIVTGNAWAWKLALVAMGVTYLSYFGQIVYADYWRTNAGLVVLSVLLGAASGFVLL